MHLSFLKDIKPRRSNYRIQVKVIHSWRQYTPIASESLELILSDAHGTKIHASCKKNYLGQLGNKLPVGAWRNIENFSLTAAGGGYRSTNHQYKMSFVYNTTVTNSTLQDNNIFLDLVDFETIQSGKLKEFLLIDVIGQVIDMGDLETVQCSGKPKKKIEFTLRDVNDKRIACCLWGKFAENFHTNVEESGDEMVICLIRFAKLGTYRGEVQISNAYDASQVLINPLIQEAAELKKIGDDENDSKALALTSASEEDKKGIQIKRDKWMQHPLKYIGELLGSTQIEECRVICTITSIDTDWGWYYFGCSTCDRKVTKIATNMKNVNGKNVVTHVWWCEKCKDKVYNVSPRFKLHLMMKDDTGDCSLLLLDSIAKVIVSESATYLLNGSFDELEDTYLFPGAINDLVGKTFMFGVFVEKENVSSKAETFKVGKVWKDLSVLAMCGMTESYSLSDIGTTNGSEQSSQLLLDNNAYEDVVSTPSSKRRVELNDDAPDLTSTSKKHCTFAIKQEKNGSGVSSFNKSG